MFEIQVGTTRWEALVEELLAFFNYLTFGMLAYLSGTLQ